MKQKGFIYSLYINGTFIENFASPDDAKNIAKECAVQGDQAVFIKPIVYFTHKVGKAAPK